MEKLKINKIIKAILDIDYKIFNADTSTTIIFEYDGKETLSFNELKTHLAVKIGRQLKLREK